MICSPRRVHPRILRNGSLISFLFPLQLAESLRRLFTDSRLQLLGFCFRSDVKHIAPLVPTAPPMCWTEIFDVQPAAQAVLKWQRLPSLSDVARMLLGHAINKRNQSSNWERRPLREDQLQYAAIDAFVLTDIYKVLQTS